MKPYHTAELRSHLSAWTLTQTALGKLPELVDLSDSSHYVAVRCALELALLRRVYTKAAEAGYTWKPPSVNTWGEKPAEADDLSWKIDTVFSVEEMRTHFQRADGTRAGTICWVFGNDGYDAVCDYSAEASLSAVIEEATSWAEDFLRGRHSLNHHLDKARYRC
jgi:hypothetical protein